ncbi:UBX domain-containing protein 7 [Frankliniella fusca]|uniref:UBX domain-containing protein 7 n=1 Tax=Frankliniella fusca TaxID=407009 RepID=A0AAE1LPV0_9NEOP|nr:UBX domain-containing protein 7 [Frankliniella fusca]
MNTSKRKKIELSDDDVASFISITGASDDIARKRLTMTNGDLMMAINQHMDSNGTLIDLEDENEVEIVEVGSSNRSGPKKDRMVQIIPPRRRGSATLNGDHQEEMLACPERAKKKKTLEDLFRPPIHLMFYGTFLAARDEATNRERWLMVNIQNMKEFSCQVLNRDIWSDSVIDSVIKQHFTFWQVYSDSGEGKKYMRFYNVPSWPYVAILDPRTGECLVEYHHISRDTFCDNILTFLNSNQWNPQQTPREGSMAFVSSSQDGPNAKSKSDEASSIVDATEEQQLEMALAASLREAATSSAAATAALSRRPDSESEDGIDDDMENQKEEEEDGDAKEKSFTPGSSPFKPVDTPPEDESSVSKMCIMLRYPDGKREEASFPSTASIHALQQYVASKGFPSSRYELVTHFPRRNLSDLKGVSLEGADLHARDTVFIQLKC